MLYYSIIIPSLNSPIIDKVLAALEDQSISKERFEVWVIGKDDRKLINPTHRIHFKETKETIPPGKARNIGASMSRGEILVFLDSDCIPSNRWLEKFEEVFSVQSIAVVGGGVKIADHNYWRLADNLSMFHEFSSTLQRGTRNHLPSLNLAIRTSVFRKSNGFDSRYPKPSGEDTDLTMRLRSMGYDLYFEPAAYVLHLSDRKSVKALVRHAFFQGKYSVKVDPRYKNDVGFPSFLRNAAALIGLSPILAAGATLRLFLRNPIHLRYLHTLPAIYVAKIAWCFGAASHPNSALIQT